MNRSYKFAKSLVNAYGKQSIFYKYWKKILLYTLIPFTLLCLTVYAIVSYNTEQKQFATTTSEFEKTLLLLNNELYNANDMYSTLSTNEYISLFLISPSTDSDLFEDLDIFKNIDYILNTPSSRTSLYIELYSSVNKNIFSSKRHGFLLAEDNIRWIDEFKAQDRQTLIQSDNSATSRITFSFTFLNSIDGLISFCIDENELIQNINAFSLNSQLCIYDKKSGITLFGNNEIAENFNIIEKNFKTKNANEYSFYAETAFDDIYLLAKCKNAPNKTNTPIGLIIFACIIISLTLSIALSYYLSIQFYKSIAVITAEIQKNFGEDGIIGGTTNELKYISTRLIELSNKNEVTEQELVNKISSLRFYQTIMLQNQFNPHFIFNILHSIILILDNQTLNDDRPVEMISLLSRLMRAAVNTERYIIQIKDELEYLHMYVQLEKINLEGCFDIEYDIDTTLLSQTTIKFILQPIFENAFEHGIKKLPASKRGKISLTIQRQKNNILISVSDNGPSMAEDTLKKLLKRLQEDDLLSSRHIGLCNTNNRIKIYYGEDFGVTNITSDENGTTVQILIPYEPN